MDEQSEKDASSCRRIDGCFVIWLEAVVTIDAKIGGVSGGEVARERRMVSSW